MGLYARTEQTSHADAHACGRGSVGLRSHLYFVYLKGRVSDAIFRTDSLSSIQAIILAIFSSQAVCSSYTKPWPSKNLISTSTSTHPLPHQLCLICSNQDIKMGPSLLYQARKPEHAPLPNVPRHHHAHRCRRRHSDRNRLSLLGGGGDQAGR